MTTEFQDITIVSVDPDRTYCPDPAKPKMLDVYLTLSAAPPAEWANYFDSQWQMTLYSMKRRAHVSGDAIVIHCPIEEIEKHHKAPLKNLVNHVNGKYREFAKAQEAKAKAKEAEEQKRRGEIKKASESIKFDD